MSEREVVSVVCTKKELLTMSMEDLKQKITNLQEIMCADENTKENIEYKNKIHKLQKEINEKQTMLKSITNEINQYFSERKQIISKNNQTCDSLQELRKQVNEQMYKMENIKLLFPKKSITNENDKKKYQLSKIEELTRKTNKLHGEIRKSYMAKNDSDKMDKIDELIIQRNKLLSEINEIQKEYNKLETDKNRETVSNKLQLDVLSTIYSIRESRIKTNETLITSQNNLEKQNMNAENLNEKRKEQRQTLYDKLEAIDSELEEYTNVNVYCSPSVSVRASITSLPDNVSESSADVTENKQSFNNLIQYLQDFLPLKMRKQIETLKMKINELEINGDSNGIDVFDEMFENMKNELQSKQCVNDKENKDEMGNYYLSHNMNIFDEFDKLDVEIPLSLPHVPSAIKTLIERMNSLERMNELFAIV